MSIMGGRSIPTPASARIARALHRAITRCRRPVLPSSYIRSFNNHRPVHVSATNGSSHPFIPTRVQHTLSESFVEGPRSLTEVQATTLPTVLHDILESHGEATFLVSPYNAQKQYSGYDFGIRVLALAQGFLDRGLAGQRVGVMTPNSADTIIATCALGAIGSTAVMIPATASLHDVEYILNQTDCTGMVLDGSFSSSGDVVHHLFPELVDHRRGAMDPVSSLNVPTMRWVIDMTERLDHAVVGAEPVTKVMNFESDYTEVSNKSEKVATDTPLLICATDGHSDKHPKLGMFSHATVISQAQRVAERLQLTKGQDIVMNIMDPSSPISLISTSLATIISGCRLVVPGPAFSPHDILSCAGQYGVTTLNGYATQFSTLVTACEGQRYNLKSLKKGFVIGQVQPLRLFDDIQRTLHLPQIGSAYGIGEAGSLLTMSSPSAALASRVRTSGQLMPHLEAKIVGLGDVVMPVGETGELLVRGFDVTPITSGDYTTFDHYKVGDWYRTGDHAMFTSEGELVVLGRVDDLVTLHVDGRGDVTIDTVYAEDALVQHPNVSNAYVVKTEEAGFAELVAWVRLKDEEVHTTTEGLKDFIRQRLPEHEIPQYIGFVKHFPSTYNGQVRRGAMRDVPLQAIGVEIDHDEYDPVTQAPQTEDGDLSIRNPFLFVGAAAAAVGMVTVMVSIAPSV